MELLDIHPANDDERVGAFRNVHDVWGGGLSLEEHVRRRVASRQHNRAKWFVGCVDGRVATSLGAYPLQFRYRGELLSGIAIAAVHTHADFRGRGFAPRLIRWVEDFLRTEDRAAISVLYSDINPDYYARLGYVQCPAWELDFEPDSEIPEQIRVNRLNLTPVPISAAVSLMSNLYDTFHRDLLISIHRPTDHWEFLSHKTTGDEVFVLGSVQEPAGYLRVGWKESTMILRDFSCGEMDEQTPSLLMSAVLQVVEQTGAKHVTGWVPQFHNEFSQLAVRRTEEITMLKGLNADVTINDPVTAAANWFHEIDHV